MTSRIPLLAIAALASVPFDARASGEDELPTLPPSSFPTYPLHPARSIPRRIACRKVARPRGSARAGRWSSPAMRAPASRRPNTTAAMRPSSPYRSFRPSTSSSSSTSRSASARRSRTVTPKATARTGASYALERAPSPPGRGSVSKSPSVACFLCGHSSPSTSSRSTATKPSSRASRRRSPGARSRPPRRPSSDLPSADTFRCSSVLSPTSSSAWVHNSSTNSGTPCWRLSERRRATHEPRRGPRRGRVLRGSAGGGTTRAESRPSARRFGEAGEFVITNEEVLAGDYTTYAGTGGVRGHALRRDCRGLVRRGLRVPSVPSCKRAMRTRSGTNRRVQPSPLREGVVQHGTARQISIPLHAPPVSLSASSTRIRERRVQRNRRREPGHVHGLQLLVLRVGAPPRPRGVPLLRRPLGPNFAHDFSRTASFPNGASVQNRGTTFGAGLVVEWVAVKKS